MAPMKLEVPVVTSTLKSSPNCELPRRVDPAVGGAVGVAVGVDGGAVGVAVGVDGGAVGVAVGGGAVGVAVGVGGGAVGVAVGVDGGAVGVAVGVGGGAVGVAVGGGAVGVAVGGGAVGVAVGVGIGPAWATADQTVTASATITRDPTTERRFVAFDTARLLICVSGVGRNHPVPGPSALIFTPYAQLSGKMSSYF